MTKAIKYLIFPLLLAAILLAYYPSVDSSYHLDDFETIVVNDLMDAPLVPLIRKYPTRWLVFLSYWVSLRPAVTDIVGKVFQIRERPARLFASLQLLFARTERLARLSYNPPAPASPEAQGQA